MVVHQQTSSPSFPVFLQKAQQLDLSPIAYQLMQSEAGPHWTKPQTVKAIAQYLAFLYLADYYPDAQLAPSLEIDQVWHYHILDTQKYIEDCQILFGYVIHHFPYSGLRGKQDRHYQREAYWLTNWLLAQYFKTDCIEQQSRPGDCEPIALRVVSNPGNHSYRSRLQLRPGIPIDIEEVLMNIPMVS